MCLGLPFKIIELKQDNIAVGELQGMNIEFSTVFICEAKLGQYVIVHAGVAIEALDEDEANKTISLLNEFMTI